MHSEIVTESEPAETIAILPEYTLTEWDKVLLTHQYRVIRRNGELTQFDANKIAGAMTKAFLAVEGQAATTSNRIHNTVRHLTQQVIKGIRRRLLESGTVHIEEIQDQVELALMRAGEHKIARAYVIYREEHAHQRAIRKETTVIHITNKQGQRYPLDEEYLRTVVTEACAYLEDVHAEIILEESLRNLFDGISEVDVNRALVMSARSLIEKEPNYTYVAARLLLEQLRGEAFRLIQWHSIPVTTTQMVDYYPEYFKSYLKYGIHHELLDPKLGEFDLDQLSKALVAERDLQFTYLGIQTLYDRYLLHWQETRFELPQAFFMRVAMGLALNETEREARAIEFYNLLSRFDLMTSTPTLFNSGTLRPQLSSCFISTIPDSAEGIMGAITDNALLSKHAGGIGNDWTPVRGMGAHIRGTNGKSGGVVPFMKIANDGLVAFNQSGKRRGSGCAYLETWHIDIEEFLELRKNTGDERRRTHDMNTANWIPDLFLERVHENQSWTLFSPDEVPQLHDSYGTAFKKTYEKYEEAARQGQVKIFKQVSAIELWRKMLTMLYETGHPWLCFKEPCNLRNPQQHVGVVHSSNLCTEICLNTTFQEIAVCNLASINLAAHIREGQLDLDKLQQTIRMGMRMLDNVIDINYYSVPQAKTSNLRHRPVGLGIMGFQDALYQLRVPYASKEAVEFADYAQEVISYYAILTSTELAQERGCYSTFSGSLWSQGILPIDSINLLAKERGQYLDISTTMSLDWESLRERVKTVGMRNSNCMAIAPTACVTGETLILSSKGLIPIASLAKSQAQWQDMQLNIVQEGNLARSDRLYLNGMKDTLRITTNRGSSIIATPNHRIRVINEQGDYVWKYFADLQIGDEVVRRLGGHEELLANKPYVSLTIPERHHFNQKSVQLPRELDESTAFILGLYMGDGYLKYSQREHYLKKEGLGIAIHQDENALVEDLYKKLNCWGLNCLVDTSKTDSGCLTHLAFSTQLVEWFEINGFSKQRGNFGEGSASAFIPQKILESNSKVLCAFLSGLFVADGTVVDRQVELATVSQQLAEQVKVCLESLNILATLSISGSGSKGSRLVYRVRSSNVYACQRFLQLIGFGASLKQQRLQENLQDSYSESDMRRGHQVCSPALIVDFIQAARHAKVDKKWLNPIACSKTNGALNIYLARQVIQYYPELQQSKLGQLLVKGNLYFELIEQIEASQNVTYDLQVPKGHTYVANGFVSHNTISNICGVTQSIEPTYQNLFVKSNLSGEFTIINLYLVRDLKALGLWDEVMVNDLKYGDGSVREIERIPPELQALYATAFEIDPTWLVEAASRRQKWLDQSQSLNLYMLEPSGRKLDNLYRLAWIRGLKTTYYLRSLGATRVQKSTVSHYQFNTTPNIPQACALADPECEACQ